MKAESIEVEDPKIDIYFQLEQGENFLDEYKTKLQLPNVQRMYAEEVSTTEIDPQIMELTKYYQQVVSIAHSKNVEFSQYTHMFWLRLKILDRSMKAKFTFSYLDTMEDIIQFRDWVQDKNGESSYSNGDQNWEFSASMKNDIVYLYEEDGSHDGDLVSNYFISHQLLNQNLNDACARATRIIAALTSALGADVWSKYRGYEWDDVKFGTNDWSP